MCQVPKTCLRPCRIWSAVVRVNKIMEEKTLLLVGRILTLKTETRYQSVTRNLTRERGIIHNEAAVGTEVVSWAVVSSSHTLALRETMS